MDDIDHLKAMLDAAEEASQFSRRQSIVTIQVDRMRLLALAYTLAVIGDSAAAVSPEFQRAHPRVPWRELSHMQDHLIHPDFIIDYSVIYETTQRDLDPLITTLKAILDSDYTKKKL